MMPVQEMASPSQKVNPQKVNPQPQPEPQLAATSTPGDGGNYKKKYKTLKRKMRMLVYEQECFNEELKKAQRKLLKVSRDRSFLLDRLLKFEKLDDTSDDSDITASSDSDGDGPRNPLPKKSKMGSQANLNLSNSPISLLPGNLNKQQASLLLQMSGGQEKLSKSETTPKRKTTKVKKLKGQGGSGGKQDSGSGTGTMTREELERHLDLKQSAKPQFMSLEPTPYGLPDDIFSHDNSNPDGDLLDIKKEEPSSLFIHMPR